MKLRRLPKIEFIWDKSEMLFGTLCFEDSAPLANGKKGRTLHSMT
jgi:hypothetical protein